MLLTDVANPQKLVAQMVTKFDQEADSLNLSAQAKALGFTPYQVLTVASMVEEEAKVPGDRPKIARVLYNRLAKGMSLGVDATVEYAIGQRVVNLTKSQLATASPYNTRPARRLAPDPHQLAGPLLPDAALSPTPGDWLYYVLAAPDGSQYFTASYADFQRATAKARAEGLFGDDRSHGERASHDPAHRCHPGGGCDSATRSVTGSPQILNAAFAATGLDWVYVAFEVAEGRAEAALDAMRALALAGLSVTMPHKTAVADHLEAVPWGELSLTARRLQAVNCVVADGDRLVGHNTDGPGFVASLSADAGFAVSGRRCGVLGAGGVARALVLGLADAGAAEVVVVNRTPSWAAGAADLAGTIGRVGEPSDLAGLDLVVNATSVGMDGRSMPVEERWLAPGQLVADIVMSPLDTPLLQAARARRVHPRRAGDAGAPGGGGLRALDRPACPHRGHGQRRPRALDSQKALYSGVQAADGEAFIPFRRSSWLFRARSKPLPFLTSCACWRRPTRRVVCA